MELEARRVLDRITGNELIGPLFSSPFTLLFARGNMLYEFKGESRFKTREWVQIPGQLWGFSLKPRLEVSLAPAFRIGEVVHLNGYVRGLSRTVLSIEAILPIQISALEQDMYEAIPKEFIVTNKIVSGYVYELDKAVK